MKANNNVYLYDAYLSCLDVVYEHNTWKNNLVRIVTANNTLMKAKGHG
jgi:hypothetical protein